MAKTYGNFTDFIDFSRASGGTYLGSDGLLKTAADNVPRVEYDANGTVKGLLIEEARTNLVTYSEDLSSTGENFAELTSSSPTAGFRYYVPNAAVSPDGGLNFAKLVESPNYDQQRIYKAYTVTSGVDYTWSVYAKAGERQYIGLRETSYSGGLHLFDLSSGVVHLNPSGNAIIEDCGGGVYRCSLTWTAGNTTSVPWISISDDGVDDAYIGDGTSGVYVWGAQLEQGSFATSYIPTSGATATRSADIADIATANFGYNYSNTVGTFVVDFQSFSTVQTAARAMTAVLGTSRAVDINMGFEALRADVYSNHTTSDLYALNNPSAGRNKIAAAMAENNSAACANGGTVDVDTSTGTPIVASNLEIGRYFTSGYLNGHIKSLSYLPRRNTNTQLQEFTS